MTVYVEMCLLGGVYAFESWSMYEPQKNPALVVTLPHGVFLVVLLISIRLYRLNREDPTKLLVAFAGVIWALLALSSRALERHQKWVKENPK